MNKGFSNAEWTTHADKYTETADNLTSLWHRDALQVAHPKIAQLLSQSQGQAFEMLDVGCGPGGLAFEFAARYCVSQPDSAQVHITATDLADGMLELVNNQLKEDSSLASIISTVQMDGRDLDKVADASVDVVGSNFGLSIFPQRERGWQSAHRVLKSGGVLFVTAWDAESDNMHWLDMLVRLFNAAAPHVEPVPPLSQTVGTDVEKLARELEAAGFRNVKAYRTTHTVVRDPSALARALPENPAFARFLKRVPRQQFEDELLRLLQQSTAQHARIGQEDEDKQGVAVIDMTAITFVATK